MCDLTLHPHEETLLDVKEAFIKKKNQAMFYEKWQFLSVFLGHGSGLLYMEFFCTSPRVPGL